MGMSVGGSKTGPMAEINVTPLVDVMLVLLIIFMITAPIMTHRIRIDLPQPNLNPPPQLSDPPAPIEMVVRENGDLFWNKEPINLQILQAQLRVAAQRSPQPELQIAADKNTEYQKIATVMGEAKAAGMEKIGFVAAAQ